MINTMWLGELSIKNICDALVIHLLQRNNLQEKLCYTAFRNLSSRISAPFSRMNSFTFDQMYTDPNRKKKH